MNLTDALSSDAISARITAGSREELLSCIAEIACGTKNLASIDSKTVLDALIAREELASTGLGSGVAVPHCRLPGLDSITMGLVTTAKKINFDAADNEKVDIFPFVIGPESAPKLHLKALSGISRVLRNPETRKAVRSAETGEAIHRLLLEAAGEGQGRSLPAPLCAMKLLHVFVRNETQFNDILQVFASGDYTGAMVVEAHESTEYMSSMPVFAGFWNSELSTFNRIIIAVVKDSLVNQTIRQIEYVAGDLTGQTDVMVTVSDLHHALGSLDF